MTHRGCGTRQPGGLYICCGVGADGRPLEDFLLDPPRSIKQGPLRSPALLQRACPLEEAPRRPGDDCPTCEGIGGHQPRTDLLVYVGEEGYPCVPDFIEEARTMGVSRRIPMNFPVEKLSPRSRMYLYHRRGVFVDARSPGAQRQSLGGWATSVTEAVGQEWRRSPQAHHCWQGIHEPASLKCIMAHWPLASRLPGARHLEDGWSEREVGSIVYRVPTFPACDPVFDMAVFAAFPITQVQWVAPRGKAVDPTLAQRSRDWRTPLEVVPQERADEPIYAPEPVLGR